MPRAGRKRTISGATTSSAPPTAHARAGLTPRPQSKRAATVDDSTVTDVMCSAAGTFVKSATVESDQRCQHQRQLAITVRQRIESRLPGRVRNLTVQVLGNAVVLEGQCATYYTKQLAQHAALGILEDEQLENAIVVCVAR